VTVGRIPDALPATAHDLVVASEVLYYLTPAELERTLDALEQLLAPGGRLVCVHWRPGGPERPLDAATVHDEVRRQPWLAHTRSASTEEYMLDLLRRR
jgi:O-methyltransferase involved in polyketide biosynthesis